MVRNLRFTRPNSIQDDLSNLNVASSSSNNNAKKRWRNLLPLLVALVVIAEIAFLGRLDMAENAALVNSVAESFYQYTRSSGRKRSGPETCEEWLERRDALAYSRDFQENPILVTGPPEDFPSCSVGCQFGLEFLKRPDAVLGLNEENETASVLRSMESSQYYADNNLAKARWMGYNITMTTSLSSDVPVGYFSWAEYDIMAPLEPKTEGALAAAFISNCAARNFRLKALQTLMKLDIKIDSYGACHRNRYKRVDKVKALKHYKFSLAFENSNEEDYVTEKFFQSLVAGSVPVVVGAPNIQDFAPSPGSVLLIRDSKDIVPVAKTMKYLAENPDAYNQSLRWKFEGPSDSFKALLDMAAVHSSCRLCIHLATMMREKEEKSPDTPIRPCKCSRGKDTVYHAYVRERGRFEMESIFLR